MIDISKIQPGDKFTVELTARAPKHGARPSNHGPCTYGSQDNPYMLHGNSIITTDMVIGHTPKPREIVVGDRITLLRLNDLLTRTVKAVFDGQVAYELSGGGSPRITYHCEHLKYVKLVDDDQ